MIIQLRRKHTYIWLTLAILLPLAVLWAYFNIPSNQTNTFSRCEGHPSQVYSSIISSKQTPNIKANLRSDAEGKRQIEVIILQPLVGAANQLFLSNSANSPQQVLLGSLESKGIYYFPLPDTFPKSPLFLMIFDVIKKKEVEKLVLNQ